MADFEMRNFHHFPMEKSSYDLKLELLEELDPKEAFELMKASDGFRSIYLKDPWRILGRHVHSISLFDTVRIHKLPQSPPLDRDLLFHLPFLKKIRSCVYFDYRLYGRTQRQIDAGRNFLGNLDSIGKWKDPIREPKDFEECFSNFKGQITDRIYLNLTWYFEEENNPTLSVFFKAFETRLGKCKEVSVCCVVDQFSIISELFSETKIKRILFYFDPTKRFSTADLEMAMRWIVSNGIPSQNREAYISICLYADRSRSAFNSLGNFLSAFRGIEKMPDEKYIRSYRRKIDDERDCIYQFELNLDGKPDYFSAKYAPSQCQ